MKVIEEQAKRISSFYISHGVIDEKEREIYDYCYEILVSTLLITFIISLIGIVTDYLGCTICFMVTFAMLKSTVGGYHANSHYGCIVGTVGIYLIYRTLAAIIPMEIMSRLSVILTVFSGLTVFFLAPVGVEKKPLGKRQRNMLKKESRIMILCLIALSLVIMRGAPKYAFSLDCGMMAVSITLIIEHRKAKEDNL
ncbi:accessory gene regulator B family protein [Clostridiales bacterium FE2011]|nr:accessory gene regulator B family protein [Clostridiales bacterium FE2011]